MKMTALTVVSAVGFFMPASAAAAPGDGGQVAVAPQLTMATLGLDPAIVFFGGQGVSSLTVPVPPGLVPASIDAQLQIPVNMASGALTVSQGDRTLSQVALPLSGTAPISIPLTGALIVDNAVNVVLRTYLTPIEGYCFDPTNPLRLVDATIRYDGVETPPTTIADFLPPVLQQLDVFLPAQPSRAETAAAIRLATAVVARYGRQHTNVAVLPMADGATAPPGPSLPLHRQVVIREEDGTGVSLLGTDGVPALLITGPAGELTNQTRLLSSDVSRIAMSSKAVVGPLRSSPQLPADDTTLSELGQQGLTATAFNPQVSIALDQTQQGRPIHGVRVQLEGSYTPLPASVGGQLVVAIGNDVLARWPADSSGSIDRWVDVPDRLLQRYTNLGVTVQIAGATGGCGEFQPVTVILDGDTRVVTQRAAPPLPSGFQSLPQALMPLIQVGVNDGIDDARRATTIMVALQRLSALPIDTTVVDLKDAVNSPNPAVLISAEGWTDNRLKLPIAVDQGGQISVGSPDGSGDATTLTLDPAMAFGSLQTVYDGSRTVLIATSNGAPAQLDELLDWVNADTDRWSQVKGSALISTTGHEPVAYGAGEPEPVQAEPAAGRPAVYWGAGIAVAVLVVASAATLVMRRRRPRPS